MRFVRLSYELNVQGRHLGIVRCENLRRIGLRRRSSWEWKRTFGRGIRVSYRTWHKSSTVFARPGKRGGASLPVQGRPECAHWGTWRPGQVPTDQGFPNQRASWKIVQVSPVPFRHSGRNLRWIAPEGGRIYTPRPRLEGPLGIFCV